MNKMVILPRTCILHHSLLTASVSSAKPSQCCCLPRPFILHHSLLTASITSAKPSQCCCLPRTFILHHSLLTASITSAKPSQCCCSSSRSKVKLMLRLQTVCCSSCVSMMLLSTATTSENSVRLEHRRVGSTNEACTNA